MNQFQCCVCLKPVLLKDAYRIETNFGMPWVHVVCSPECANCVLDALKFLNHFLQEQRIQ